MDDDAVDDRLCYRCEEEGEEKKEGGKDVEFKRDGIIRNQSTNSGRGQQL